MNDVRRSGASRAEDRETQWSSALLSNTLPGMDMRKLPESLRQCYCRRFGVPA
ncbi:hypothetical protein TSOC111612_23415 [Tsukamurella ocularis]